MDKKMTKKGFKSEGSSRAVWFYLKACFVSQTEYGKCHVGKKKQKQTSFQIYPTQENSNLANGINCTPRHTWNVYSQAPNNSEKIPSDMKFF